MFHVPNFPMLAPRYNIAPTQLVICVREVSEQPNSREAVPMRWGLIPFWAKDMTIGNQLINARSETVAEKPSFRNAFAKRRCLIPADGFFEWQKLSTGKKQPWLIERVDHQPFAMAGLWECWTPKRSPDETSDDHDDSGDAEQGRAEPVISCTILTTGANEDMKPLHDRMPVILPIEAWAAWLSPSSSKGQLSSLLSPQPAGQLRRTCVSTVVNRPFPDNADCIAPVDPPEPLG
jgi:putative SOS response-associated peptidase YedK